MDVVSGDRLVSEYLSRLHAAARVPPAPRRTALVGPVPAPAPVVRSVWGGREVAAVLLLAVGGLALAVALLVPLEGLLPAAYLALVLQRQAARPPKHGSDLAG